MAEQPDLTHEQLTDPSGGYLPNRRDRVAFARAHRSTRESLDRFADTFQALKDRPRIPNEFLCTKCVFVPLAKLQGLIDWIVSTDAESQQHYILHNALEKWHVSAYNEKTRKLMPIPSMLRCRCEQAEQQAAADALAAEARAEMQQAERVAWAHFPQHDGEPPKTFDNFKITAKTRETAEAGKAFGVDGSRKTLILIGVTGCGKSHVLEAIGRRLLPAGVAVRYEYCPAMLERWRYASSIDTDDDLYVLMTALADVEVLLLDDFALDTPTAKMGAALTALIDTRIREGRLTVLSTNVTNPKAMIDMGWPAPLASRLFDQRTGAVRQVWSKADDYRRAT